MQVSALEEQGVDAFWSGGDAVPRAAGGLRGLAARRHAQDQAWMWTRIEAGLRPALPRARGGARGAAAA
jgi:LAO/AO transport system kinase